MTEHDVENAEEDVENAEELEAASKTISKEEARGSFKLWFAVLGSPFAWFGHLGGNYSLEEWFACSPSAHEKGEILGYEVQTVSILLNSVMLLVAVASGLVAYACWKKLRANSEGESEGDSEGDTMERARWMAFAGIVEGCLFVGIILLGYLPALTLGSCETAP